MLGFFRRLIHSRVGMIVTFGVLGIIALAFAASDITGFSGKGGITGTSVATVGGKSIGAGEFRKAAQSEMEGFRQNQPTLDMAQFIAGGGLDGTLQRMMNGLALEAFAKDQGIVVSKRLADGELASIPALQGPTGKFDQALYERILAQRGLTDAQIRGDLIRDLYSRLLMVPTIGASQIPQTMALPYASLLLEKREGQIAFIPTRAMGAGTAPTDQEIQTFYQRNIQRYTTPERRVMRYALVTPAAVKAQAVPTDAEIAKAYATDRAKYAPTQKRTIVQATVLDQAAATALATKVKAGTSLADAARAAGLEARTITGVDKTAYTQQAGGAAADAVFTAAQGAVVGPVRGAIGFVVARVEGIRQVPGKSLGEARGEIVAALTASKTQEALGKIRDGLDDAIGNNANFNELVADQKLTAQTTQPLTSTGANPEDAASKPDPALAPIVAAGFAAEEGDTPTLVQAGTDGSFAVVGLDRIVRAAPRPLAKVREAVVRDFSIDRARAAARQVASAVNAKVNKGMPLPQALADTKLSLPPVQPLAAPRAQLAQNPRGAPPPLVLLFSMAQGTAKLLEAPEQGGWFVIKLDRIIPGDAGRQAGVVGATRADLGRVIGREYVEQFTTAVRNSVGVKRNDAAVAGVRRDLLGQGGSNQP